MNFKTKLLVFTFLFAFIVLVNIWVILNTKTDLYFILRPLETLFLLISYVLIVKKVKRLYLLSLTCVIIANFFYFYDKTCFLVAMLFYTANHILLGLEIFKFRNSVKFNMLFKYFFMLSIALVIIYFFVIKDQEGHSVSILIFGISLCMAVAIAMVNYLRNMIAPNFYLLLGLLIGLITNIIVSLNIFKLTSDSTLILLTTFLFAIAHYFICFSFILKDNYRQLNKCSF